MATIKDDLITAYVSGGTVRTFFEPAADLILLTATKTVGVKDLFSEYFAYLGEKPTFGSIPSPGPCKFFPMPWPMPVTCLQLEGSRGTVKGEIDPAGNPVVQKRLFLGDVAWLFNFEHMGLFAIVKELLDDYEQSGKTPFDRDDITAFILEVMVRERRTFLGSRTIDRDSTYRRCLGWTVKSKSTATANGAFADHFDRLIGLALTFYRERRLVDAVRKLASSGSGSTASLVDIQETIRVLKSAMDTFKFGRNYTNALSGIVWVVATLQLINDLLGVIGVPATYKALEQFVPAAYDLLVGKEPVTPTRKNRFLLYRSLAEHSRAILMDIEVLDALVTDTAKLGEWMDLVEGNFHAYATAYRDLHGVDFASGGKHLHRA